jgi:hypothetical protein
MTITLSRFHSEGKGGRNNWPPIFDEMQTELTECGIEGRKRESLNEEKHEQDSIHSVRGYF